MTGTPSEHPLLAGARAAVPFAVPVFAFGVSLGVLAKGAGYSFLATVVMSSVTFVGSAQFATISVVAGGGSIIAATFAGGLLTLRYLLMGFAIAPTLRGSRLRRARDAQLVIEESWAIAVTPSGGFDYERLMGSGVVLWVGWTAGTALGAAGSFSSADLYRFGFDAISPALFFLLLVGHLDTFKKRMLVLSSSVIVLAFMIAGAADWALWAVCLLALLTSRRETT